jgi:hypothetical protein
MRWVVQEARVGEMRNVYNILVGKPGGKRSLERHRRIWGDNITMDLREMVLEGMEWIHLAHDKDRWLAVVNTVMNIQVP